MQCVGLVPSCLGETTVNLFDLAQDYIFFRPSKTPLDHVYRFHHEPCFREVFYHVPSPPKNMNGGDTVVNDDLLHSIFFYSNKDQRFSEKGVCLWFHGNSGTVSDWGHLAVLFTERGYDVLLPDYRKFGKSTGDMTEDRLHQDALYLYKQLRKTYPANKIYIHGTSIGTAIAIHLASQQPCKALVLETPFANVSSILRYHLSIGQLDPGSLLHPFLKYKFNALEDIGSVDCPIYAIHGLKDSVIPICTARQLFQEIRRKDCYLLEVDDADHSIVFSAYYLPFLDVVYE